MREVVFRIEGMCCATEAARVDEALRAAPGVAGWSTSALDGTLRVELDGAGNTATVIEAVRAAGFEAGLVDEAGAGSHTDDGTRARLAASLCAAACLTLAGSIALTFGDRFVGIAFCLIAVVIGGIPTARRAWAGVRRRELDMHVLMTVAVIGAVILGEWLEGAVVVVLFAVANALEAYSLARARAAISSLLDLTPPTAVIKRDGVEYTIAATGVTVGDVVVLKPGVRAPVDGTVVAGRSTMDQSPVTGESRPAAKDVGDTVFAGTLNVDGRLEVEAVRAAAESTPARMRRLVEQAEAAKAPVQQFADRFAARYTPAVIACAAAVAVLPPLLAGGAWGVWFYRALVLLVIACPCALVISTPVTLVSHLAAAARRGILFKGGAHLENLARVCTMVFDKTGTLTEGRPHVVHSTALNGATENDVLRLAAAVDASAMHPLAPVICAAARDAGVEIPQATNLHMHPGQGVHADVDGEDVWVGTLAMARGSGPLVEAAAQVVREHEAHGETTVVVGRGEVPLGVIALADTPRPDAASAVARLRDAGLHHLYMLTGDNRTVAEDLQRELGLDAAFAELLPEDKVGVVQQLLRADHAVAMVGDGINDAPALATATVGIAMGAGGSDLAVETADVTLVGNDLAALPTAIGLARSARAIVRQNIAIALGLKAVVFALAVGGFATLWLAIMADMGASLLVIGNALRPLMPWQSSHPSRGAVPCSQGGFGRALLTHQRRRPADTHY